MWAQGQSSLVQTVYCERFDTLPYQIVTGQLGLVPPATAGNKFNDTNVVAVSMTNSFHTRVQPFDTVYFQTNYFSTDTNTFVRFSFFHICNVFVSQQAVVQIDTGNGQWYVLPASTYLGGSSLYIGNQYFNMAAYAPDEPWGSINPTANPAPGIFPANSQWIKEEFDISNFAAQKNNVRLRFKLRQVQSVPLVYRGWFVDNVCVEAAPCEIFPPVISANLNPAPIPCFNNAPEGDIPLDTLIQVAMDVTDPSGISSVWINYSINGGAWQTDTLNTKPSSQNYRYFFKFPQLAIGDTVCWYVEAQDNTACENRSRYPTIDTACFQITPGPPARCGAVICSQFPNIIVNFPWTESFEGNGWVPGSGTGTPPSVTHRGTIPFDQNWSVSPAATNGLGWSVWQGATPSATTGPSGAHSGQKLIYFESSFSGPPTNSQLITPCIDLRQVQGCAALEFYYHRYGNGMGNLRVDVDTGDGTALNNSQWITGVLTITGQTQTSKSSAWTKAFVSLQPYAGKIIKLRFVGFKGANDNGDMAIDALRVYEPDPLEIELVQILKPQNGFCGYSATEDVRVRLRNQGCLSVVNPQVRFRENPALPWKVAVLPFTLAGGKDTTVTLPAPAQANLAALGTYNVEVEAVLPGDADTTNNKLSVVINHEATLSTFPFIENFDGSNTVAGNGTSNSGTFTNANLTLNPAPPGVLPPGYNEFGFWVENRLTNSDDTGPARDRSNFGQYIYTENNFGTFPTSSVILTRCLDLSALTSPTLDFWLFNFGTNSGPVNVQVKTQGTNTWTNLGTAITTQQQSDEWDDWQLVRRDLTTYAGTVIQLRIVVGKSSTAGTAGDVSIDNIHIYNRTASDVGVKFINAPDNNISVNANGTISLEIQNYGTASVSNIPFAVDLKPLCGPNAGVVTTVTGTATASIAANSSAVVTVQSPNGFPRGHFEVEAKTTLAADINAFNNSVKKLVVGVRNDTIPIFYNFDDCGAQPYSIQSAYPLKSGNTLRFFELGTPTQSGISAAFSAPNAWVTGPSENYRRGKDEVLMLPPLLGFDTVEGVLLRFRHNIKLGSGAGARVEFLQGTAWQALGNASVPGPSSPVQNWYSNTIFGGASIPALGGNPGWQGSSGGWVQSAYPLAQFSNQSGAVNIRFRMASSTFDSPDNGWAIDNIEVVVPAQRSASPIDIRSVAPLPVPGPNQYMVRIQNTGAKALDSVFVKLTANGSVNIASEWVTFDPPLFSGQSRWDTLVSPWANSPSGCHNMEVITSTPNNRIDNFPTDDTLNKVICILDVLTSFPYCNNFNTPADTTWLHKNAITYDNGTNSFRAGAPNKSTINAPFSAPWCYTAGFKTGLYKNRDSSALFTPAFSVDTTSHYEISFQHWMKSERYHDGGTVEVTMDGGRTWQVIGGPGPDWFNTPYVTILEIIKPGWTGTVPGFIQAQQVIRFSAPGNAIFRFRFMSDQSIVDEGWAIDDFCFDTTNALVDFTVGLDELPETGMAIGLPSPNPASSEVVLPILVNDNKTLHFSITNAMGQVIYQNTERYSAGPQEVKFDVNGWATGMYFIVIDGGESPVVRKLLIQR
jgi:hypothetical protein